MQQVTVRPRSTFRHYVRVDSAGKELVWNFGTKKKNISFGLFRQPEDDQIDASAAAAGGSGSATRRSSQQSQPQPQIQTQTQTDGIASILMRRRTTTTGSNSSSSSSPLKPPQNQPHSSTSPTASLAVDPEPTSPTPTLSLADNLIELMPITHYDSSKLTIKGSYRVATPGTYVLVFDNTFSLNTSKRLFFFVAIRDIPSTDAMAAVMSQKKHVEGWILKKGNRKMQGYLKRWLQINSDGVLSYYKEPGGQPHAVVPLNSTAVRLDHDNLLIDIDTGTTIIHMKSQTNPEFQVWVDCLQSHIQTSKFQSPAHTFVRGNSNISNMTADSSQYEEGIGKSGGADVSLPTSQYQVAADRAVATILEELSQIKSLADAGDVNYMPAISLRSNNLIEATSDLQTTLQSLQKSVKSLADQFSQTQLAFQNCLNDNNKTRAELSLPPIPEVAFRIPMKRLGSITLHPGQMDDDLSSLHSSIQFFDALEDGSASEAEEFEAIPDFTDSSPSRNPVVKPEDPIIENDTDSLEDGELVSAKSQAIIGDGASSSSTGKLAEPLPSKTQEAAPPTYDASVSIARRACLPAPPVSMENISLLSILRNNVGKDLSTIAMPIALNEPLNLLQRLAEELEYCDLLEKADQTKDPVDRILVMSAFAISGYAGTINRAGRKPFNPLLGETYECIRLDKGFRFISEKVSHHPPVMACHATSPHYTFYQDNQVNSKFWGKSMELVPSGLVHVSLTESKDHYVWNKVTTCMRNVFSGTRYLEHYGTMKLESRVSGYTASIVFKESGYFASAKNEVNVTVVDAKGVEVAWMTGKWDDAMYRYEKAAPDRLQVVWRATPAPPHHPQMYGFTQFAVELNELTRDLEGLLPCTDTRFRPDQRLYESGRIEEAEAEKLRLEQYQRIRRKEMEAQGLKWTPRWFEKGDDSGEWRFKGGYFESRGAFTNQVDIFLEQ